MKSMANIIFIVLLAGFVYLVLFYKPAVVSDEQIVGWFSSKLTDISEKLEADIELDKKGEYNHAGKETFAKIGAITYLLRDKNYDRFDISDTREIAAADLRATQGYKVLEKKALGLGLSFQLKEVDVEGDGVESFDEIDEYIDDYPRYYIVTVRGW